MGQKSRLHSVTIKMPPVGLSEGDTRPTKVPSQNNPPFHLPDLSSLLLFVFSCDSVTGRLKVAYLYSSNGVRQGVCFLTKVNPKGYFFDGKAFVRVCGKAFVFSCLKPFHIDTVCRTYLALYVVQFLGVETFGSCGSLRCKTKVGS